MSHVLEHVAEPGDFLAQAMSYLKPGGLIFIEVPCSDFKYKEIFDAHILFFEKRSMHHLLSELELEDIAVSYHGELIETLQKTIGLQAKVRRRLARLLRLGTNAAVVAPSPSFINAEMWAQVAPYDPCEEKDRPARWLRATARKVAGG
jgi:hypothetical protein